MNTVTTAYTLSDFDFELPPELIAQHPAAERTGSRLLHVQPAADAGAPSLSDRQFADLPGLLAPGDLLLFNDTKVIKARLFGHKASGGSVEVLVERIDAAGHEALAMIRASKSPKPDTTLRLEDAIDCTVLGRDGAGGEFFRLRFDASSDADNWWAALDAHGRLPLPPYIEHAADGTDESRYQTVYAKNPGAVAAPTAGLHFDDALLACLREQGVEQATVTLHVGAGTFQPVRVENLSEHQMHRECYDIPAATAAAIAACRQRGGKVVAVGTTTLRALESAADPANPGHVRTGPGETGIFITPGYRFQVVDRLITNFHLPKSTLLMLVSAFSGYTTLRTAYAHAVAQRYRFFSYGDAMLLERTAP